MRRTLPARAWIASALACAATGAHAAHPLITEDTGTQGAGGMQLELTLEASHDHDAGTTTRARQPAAVFSYGVTETADLQVSVPHQRQVVDDTIARTRNAGGGDLSVDLKWRALERDALSLGIKPGLTLASGDPVKGLGTGRTTWGGLLIASWEPGGFALHAHLGYRRSRNLQAQRVDLWHLSAAVTHDVGAGVRLVADLSRDTNPDPASGVSVRQVVLGAIWAVTPKFDLDLGVKLGLSTPAPDRALLAGATFRW